MAIWYHQTPLVVLNIDEVCFSALAPLAVLASAIFFCSLLVGVCFRMLESGPLLVLDLEMDRGTVPIAYSESRTNSGSLLDVLGLEHEGSQICM